MGKLSGKTVMVTGANTGIGRVTALELSRMQAHVILACRSKEKTEPVVEALKRETKNEHVEYLHLDLSSFDAVRASAENFLSRDLPLHVLINNAGLAGHRGVTKDGFELAFGVNHLGHFLFTNLLLKRLEQSAPARIVNVASKAHYKAPGIDFEAVGASTVTTTGLPEYQVSKLANVLFTAELARRLQGSNVSCYSLHPGVVASDVWRNVPWPVRAVMKLFMISNEDGAKTTVHCAASEEAGAQTGLYYDECKVVEPSALAKDEKLAAELWSRSAQWTGLNEI